MTEKAIQLLEFNQALLRRWTDELLNHTELLKIKYFKHLFKQCDKLLVRSTKIEPEEYQDFFYDLYELIYKKYFSESITDFMERMLQDYQIRALDKVQWIWKLWFEINTLQWWWFQISSKVDFLDPELVMIIRNKTYNSLAYCLHDLFVLYRDEQNFNQQYLPLMEELIKNYQTVSDVTSFEQFILQADAINPHVEFEEVVRMQNEDVLDRYVFSEMICNFIPVINFIEKWANS